MFASLMSVFENRVLREMPKHKRDEVTGEWRRLQTEEFHYFFFSWLDNCSMPRPAS
jgi:hypothetical protein